MKDKCLNLRGTTLADFSDLDKTVRVRFVVIVEVTKADHEHGIYPPSQKTTAVRPWMNAGADPPKLGERPAFAAEAAASAE